MSKQAAKIPGAVTERPDLTRGDRVVVTEEGISPWPGTVTAVKPSSVSGWWVEVDRDGEGVWALCLATGVEIARAEIDRAGKEER